MNEVLAEITEIHLEELVERDPFLQGFAEYDLYVTVRDGQLASWLVAAPGEGDE